VADCFRRLNRHACGIVHFWRTAMTTKLTGTTSLLSAAPWARHASFVSPLALLCVTFYVLRSSLIPRVFSNPYIDLLAPITIVVLTLVAACVVASGIGRLNVWACILVVATGVSLIHCERFSFALPRWLGWVVLLFALGPLNSTAVARYLRSRLSSFLNNAFIAIVFLSLGWWAAGLSNLGRGDFTGVMGHSMVLGPIAAYVGILAIVRLFSRGSLLWIVPYGSSWLVAMLASSRSALAAGVIGTLVVVAVNFKRNLVLALGLAAVAAVVVLMPDESLGFAAQFLPSSLTEGLANKSWNNSREAHWNARWEEFLSSPVTGIGFATAWEDSAGVDESGTVEPGSSYIAVMSMTGCAGVAACLVFIVSFAWRVLRRWRLLRNRERLQICGLAAFWCVHLGAEGYVYAVGSLLGAAFWLWCGCLNDELCGLECRSATSKRLRMVGSTHSIRRPVLVPVRSQHSVRGLNR
jgi:O-Antigen ligase